MLKNNLEYAAKGFKLIEYVRDQFCTTTKAGLQRLDLELWSRASEPENFERARELDLESLGRAFQRAGLVDLLWEVSQSFDRGLSLCSPAAILVPDHWRPIYLKHSDGTTELIGKSARSVPPSRRVSYNQAENLYYYFLDELHASSH